MTSGTAVPGLHPGYALKLSRLKRNAAQPLLQMFTGPVGAASAAMLSVPSQGSGLHKGYQRPRPPYDQYSCARRV